MQVLHRVLRSLDSFAGFSRHSALSSVRPSQLLQSARDVAEPIRPVRTIVVSLLVGCSLIGVAVALIVEAQLGLPPYDVLSAGLGAELGISLGQAGWLVAGVLFALAACLGHRPNGWSVAFVLGNGLAIDAMSGLINQPDGLAGRLIFVVVGIVAMAVGVNAVIHAGVTGGPFELLMSAAEDRGIDRTLTRYVLDLTVLGLGIAVGGPLGIATIVYAATMGLVLRRIRQVLLDHQAGKLARLEIPQHRGEPALR